MAEVLPGSASQIAQSAGQSGAESSTAQARSAKLETAATVQQAAQAHLVAAVQVAADAEARVSPNGVRFAMFGETGLADADVQGMLEAVPAGIVAALAANTYYFVPLALREKDMAAGDAPEGETPAAADPAMIASAATDDFLDAAICHRNVDLEGGQRGVFISTRLLADRFALSFEFFINVAHAFVDAAGVPEAFAVLVWTQATENVRGETSMDAWETRNVAFGRAANAGPEPLQTGLRRLRGAGRESRDQRSFTGTLSLAASAGSAESDEKPRGEYVAAAFSDALAIYLLSMTLDFDYSELRERDYPLLQPQALAARLSLVAELFPPNAAFEFAVKYRRRA